MQNAQYDYLDSRHQNLTILGSEEKKSTCLAKDTVTGQMVVKKYIQPENIKVYAQLSALQSPHLVKIYHVAGKEDAALVIMEYVSGKTIEEWQKEISVFSEEKTIDYMYQLLSGLLEIHNLGIVHRDINPKNVLISTDGVVKLLDFDIGRQYKEAQKSDTTILGTAGYAAPEQFGFTQSDKRTDIYAVGVLMNVMLTGKLPGEEVYANGRVGYIIKKCVQIAPENRYQNVEEILQEIQMINIVKTQEITGIVFESETVASTMSEKEKDIKRRIIPGFRTGMLWKKIVAAVYYALIGLYAGIGEIVCIEERKPLAAFVEIIAIIIAYILSVFLPLNFLNWMDKTPGIRRMGKIERIIMGIVLWFLLLYAGTELENYMRSNML